MNCLFDNRGNSGKGKSCLVVKRMNSLTSQQAGIIGNTVINSNASNRKHWLGMCAAQCANSILGAIQDEMGIFPGKSQLCVSFNAKCPNQCKFR